MITRHAGWLALICSFVVYFIPIAGPHAVFLVFEALSQQWRDPRNLAWALSNLGAAVTLQAGAFALFYWFWRSRRLLPLVALAAYGIGAVVLVQFVYMLWLPAHFLIEAETSPETETWPEACRVAGASVMTWRTPRRLPQQGWSEAWLSDSQNRQFILRMPDCRQIPVPLPQPQMKPDGRVDFSIGITQVVPGGLALVQRQEVSTGKTTWHLLNGADGTLTPLAAPETRDSVAPYLSDDGSETAWIVPIAGSGPPVLDTLQLLPVQPGARSAALDLARFGAASYEVVGVDRASDEVLLWVSIPGRLLATGMDGQKRAAPAIPTGVTPQSHTIVLTQHGVVAWDAYKENDDYRIAWSMDTGSGTRRIPKGSSIQAASADPSGRYVAVSTSTTLNIGHVRDSVFVFRVADGREVFRRFLPTYSRTNVVFLGSDYFVYSDTGAVHVLKIPGAAPAQPSEAHILPRLRLSHYQDPLPAIPSDFTYGGRPIEAACIQQVLRGGRRRVVLADCPRPASVLDCALSANHDDDPWWDLRGYRGYCYRIEERGPGGAIDRQIDIIYKYLGRLGGHHAVLAESGMGASSSSVTRTLVLLDVTSNPAALVRVETGATRSPIPIDARVRGGNLFNTAVVQGPDLAGLSDLDLGAAGVSLSDFPESQMLADSDVAEFENGSLRRVVLIPRASDGAGPGRGAACLRQVRQRYLERQQAELSPPALRTFMGDVIACMKAVR